MNVISVALLLLCFGCSRQWALDLRKVSQFERMVEAAKTKERAANHGGDSLGPTDRPQEESNVESEGLLGNEFVAPETVASEVVSEEPPEIDFEHAQIQTLIKFIEFRLDEVNALINECVQRHFEFDPNVEMRKVKSDCVGNRFQILYRNYHEGLRRLKAILMEMMRIKLQQLDDLYYDEVQYFMDLLEQIVDSDYLVMKTLEVAKQSSKYYSTPRLFEQVVGVVRTEIDTFDAVHQRFATKRRDIQRHLESLFGPEEEPLESVHSNNINEPEDWLWNEDDIPQMEPDVESSEESEEEQETQEPEEENDESPSHSEEEPNQDEEEATEPDEEVNEEESELESAAEESPGNELAETTQAARSQPPEETDEEEPPAMRRRRAPKNPVLDIGDKFGKGVSATSDFAVNTIDKVLNSAPVLSFIESLSSQLEGALKNQPGEQ